MSEPANGSFAPFARTRQFVLGARLRRHAGLIVAVLALLAGWCGWLFLGRVSIYVVSQQMRVESAKFPLPVEVPVEGVVRACDLGLGRYVEQGDVLVRLDTRTLELERNGLDAEIHADEVAVQSLGIQVEAERNARSAVAELARKTESAGAAKVEASRTLSSYKDLETGFAERLHHATLLSDLDLLRAKGDAESLRAQLLASFAQAALDSSNGRVTVKDRDARIAGLDKTHADAQALLAVHRARLESTSHEIERRDIRAVATGSLADIVPCTPGMTVQPGTHLATLLPRSELRVVSFFRPEEAVGRIKPGQGARLLLDNFPWTQYGTVNAAVDQMGNEARAGLVRVELVIVGKNPQIPLLHGLTGSVEVEVEKTSPWRLLLRMSGQSLSASPPAPSAPKQPDLPPRAGR